MALFHLRARGITPGESFSFGVYATGSGTIDSALTTWNDAVDGLWTDKMDQNCTADVEITELIVASISSADGKQLLRRQMDVSFPGVATGEMLPFQCATCISWSADLATRAGRGRIYMPPFAASTLDAGRVSSAAQTVAVNGANLMWGSLNTGGLELVLYSQTHFTTNTVTGGNVGNVFDTQRRRRSKLIEVRSALTAP